MEMNKKELELYFHIPFCARKCNYCDFLSAPATEAVQEAYMEAMKAEVKRRYSFSAYILQENYYQLIEDCRMNP